MLRHDHPTSTARQHAPSSSPPPHENTDHQQAWETEKKGTSQDQTSISHLSNAHTFYATSEIAHMSSDSMLWETSRISGNSYCSLVLCNFTKLWAPQIKLCACTDTSKSEINQNYQHEKTLKIHIFFFLFYVVMTSEHIALSLSLSLPYNHITNTDCPLCQTAL